VTSQPVETVSKRLGRPRLSRRRANLLAGLLGLVLMGGLFAVFEGGFYALNRARNGEEGPRYISDPEYRRFDADLGVAPIPGVRARHAKFCGDEPVFDAHYTIDADGRRDVPVADAGTVSRGALLVSGCSFAFGTGVEDDETLPAYLAGEVPDYRVYNYAFQGYGPQHVLAMIEDGRFARELEEDRAFLLYVFIPDHIRRVIGSSKVVCGWIHGDGYPYYDYDASGMVCRFGSFASGRPWRQSWYGLLRREQCMKFFGTDWPPRLTEGHKRLTADVLKRAVDLFAEQYGPNSACVVLYPGDVRYTEQSDSGRSFIPYLEAVSVPYIDCTDAFDLGEEGYSIPRDGHPTPKAHQIIARSIATFLEQGGALARRRSFSVESGDVRGVVPRMPTVELPRS